MKPKHLIDRFIRMYLLIGIVMFFITTLVGSFLIEQYLTRIVARNLNMEAFSIGENQNIIDSILLGQIDEVETNLRTIANYENSTIWIIDSQKNLLVSTDKDYSRRLPAEFNPEEWAAETYEKGTFYGYFMQPRLSVVDKIRFTNQDNGYVVLHYQMTRLYERRGGALWIMQVIYVLVYLSNSALLYLSYKKVHKPLMEVIKGAKEYASGNLFYQIPDTSDDEFGYLAKTLNYMADAMNQNGTYQRQFISNVSHDFRSPLTSIKGYAEAMQDGTIPPEYYGRYLNIIISETERLEKLTLSIRSLNDLDTKKQTLHMEPFDLNEIIQSTAASFEGTCYEHQINLVTPHTPAPLIVLADKEQIKQVLYNLIDNAIKFSPVHSSILVSVTQKNERVFVSVKDFGSGIPKGDLPKIWERFYKADTSRGKIRTGTGLGLSIVREIIHAHNQHIDVISTEGEGTEFVFSLEKAPTESIQTK